MNAPLPRLIKTRWGFYQYTPLPSDEELRAYYERKYFQEGRGSYETSYSEEEIRYFRLKTSMIYRKAHQIAGHSADQTLLDIGCGEGWGMNEFHRQGCNVWGVDYSRYGMEKFHPHLLPYLEQGHVHDLLLRKAEGGQTYDYLLCANVIEHVKDPAQLLKDVRKLMRPKSVLVIIAPNDFSTLHRYLLEQRKISREFWLCYPDHLSYFNKESMSALLSDLEFELVSILADNPIDLNLLNDNSNYVEDAAKGKNTHLFRVRSDIFLSTIDPDGLFRIYETLGAMGVGRNLLYFCTVQR